jgi:predicted transcriptional regulator
MSERTKSARPTDSELAILNILWRTGPCSVREVWKRLGKKTGYTTALKTMQIMLEKGLVKRDERTFSHIYEAAAPERETQEKLVSGLIDRAFNGSASQLVLRALSAKQVPATELRAIRELLAEAEKKMR